MVKELGPLLALLPLLAACSTDDSSIDARAIGDGNGGTADAATSSGGVTASGGSVVDSGFSAGGQGMPCDSPFVSHVTLYTLSEVGSSRSALELGDAGGPRLALPADPCGNKAIACPNGRQPVFLCPLVTNQDGSANVQPGDTISVRVPITDYGLDHYSCGGIDVNTLEMPAALFYAVSPAYADETGKIPAGFPHGKALKATAGLTGAHEDACIDDFVQVTFDVNVP
jgi:hypothetical protein